MKAPSPAFSFYPKDILSDENCAAMTLEEFGAYMRLLCHAWLEGSVPADPVKLARILKVRHQTFRRIWPAIAPCFEPVDGDVTRLSQRRLEQERSHQRERSVINAAKGRKGGRPTQPTKQESCGLAVVKPTESLPSPSPSPSPVRIERQTERPGAPANPLIQGRRVQYEREVLAMVAEFAELENEDPVEVIARASGYTGATTTKLNPATMGDDRLLNTWRDLKKDLEEARRRKGAHGRQVRA